MLALAWWLTVMSISYLRGPTHSPTLTSLFEAPSVAVVLRKGREEGGGQGEGQQWHGGRGLQG